MPGSSKQLLGTLVVVPLVAVALGSEWTWSQEFWPASVRIRRAGSKEFAPLPESAEAGRLSFFEEGAVSDRGLELGATEVLELSLERPYRRPRLVLQAGGDDGYRVSASSEADGGGFEPVWMVPQVPGRGLRTRTSEPLSSPLAVRRLRIEPVDGDGTYAISGLKLVERHRFLHVVLIPVIYLAWGGLGALRRLGFGRGFADWALGQWRRFDAWSAGALIFAVLFEIPSSVVLGLAWLLGFVAAIKLLHLTVGRLATPRAVIAFVAVPLALNAIAGIAASVILKRVSRDHELDVDHRLVPGEEINEDRIRFLGPASQLREDDYVLVALGDSFTYGNNVAYEDSYPYVLERLLSTLVCRTRVRVANFGWASSSPLLAYRLLRDIGHKYKPDLVVYNLDMTDFNDDLRYEAEFRLYGDLEIPKHVLLARLLQSRFPLRETGLMPRPRTAAGPSEAVRAVESAALEESIPPGRFFVTSLPLEESRAAIERGVVRNLERIFRHSETHLRARMLLVILPRAFQYSKRESVRNWESHTYQTLGPYVREPFRYFEEARDELPYPVFSLLRHFEEAPEFPLYQETDPHWNETGNRLAAEGLLEYLVANRLVPCALPTDTAH
jgi:hypothetical protein